MFHKPSKRRIYGNAGQIRPARPVEVPPWVNLHPVESVVENYVPPARGARVLKPSSKLAGFRDNLLTKIYGREAVLRAPTHVVTDSKGRVVITDPQLAAVHVLDESDSFRIVAGAQQRLQQPTGLAIDADDNIYVADAKLGVVQVFDPQGRFVRSIGDYHGESMFDSPTGIAIDRRAGRLFVLDSRVGQLVVLDLEGHIVRRVGNRRDRANKIVFDHPSAVALGSGLLVVVDADATRMNVFDESLALIAQFTIRNLNGAPDNRELGLAVDGAGHIFVSNLAPACLKVFDKSGTLVGAIDRFGPSNDSLNGASGVWIDDAGRLFVADTNNSRVQVFQEAPQSVRSEN
jgi:DNA-binding beta-propeller fold protein YncE